MIIINCPFCGTLFEETNHWSCNSHRYIIYLTLTHIPYIATDRFSCFLFKNKTDIKYVLNCMPKITLRSNYIQLGITPDNIVDIVKKLENNKIFL